MRPDNSKYYDLYRNIMAVKSDHDFDENDELLPFKKQLWKSCNKLRGAMDASEYKHFVLPLTRHTSIGTYFETSCGFACFSPGKEFLQTLHCTFPVRLCSADCARISLTSSPALGA